MTKAMQFYPDGRGMMSDNKLYRLVNGSVYYRVAGEHWQGLGEAEDNAEAAKIATAHFNGKKYRYPSAKR